MKKSNRRFVELLGITLGCILLGIAILACCDTEKKKSGSGGAAAPTGSAPTAAAPQEAQTQAASQLPWLASVIKNCEAYKAAPNQIKKSAVFRKNNKLLKKAKAKNIKGILKSMSTNQGGSEVSLKIMVGNVEFATESLMEGIRRGTKVYKQVTDLAEEQCVVFSAKKIRPSSMLEQSKVCDFEYFAKFTSVKPCK